MYQLSLKPMLRAFGRGLQDAKVKFTRFDLSSSFLCCVSLCRHADALPRSYTAFGLEHDSIVFSHIFPPSFTKSSRHSQKLVFPTSSRETQVAFILTRSTSAPTTESKPEKRRRHPPPPPSPLPSRCSLKASLAFLLFGLLSSCLSSRLARMSWRL